MATGSIVLRPVVVSDQDDPLARREIAPGKRWSWSRTTTGRGRWSRCATTFFAFVVWLLLEANLTADTAALGPALRVAFLVVVLRLLWCLYDWRHELDRRHRQAATAPAWRDRAAPVPMMPFQKVTDMSYVRTMRVPPAQVSAASSWRRRPGGPQVVDWVPEPPTRPRVVCTECFHVEPTAATATDTVGFARFDDVGR